jgi:hypothetical protein
MILCNWRGKIGYGDIISPICYAHNIASRLETPFYLNFHWPFSKGHKINQHDPETLYDRADIVASYCVPADVKINHIFNSSLPYNHNAYSFVDGLHNHWYSKITNLPVNQYKIVVCGTHHNEIPLDQYGKPWKDPVGPKEWRKLVTDLSVDHLPVEVSYRTPLKDLIEELSTSSLYIGYHGSAAWVARFIGIPSIIFSSNTDLTRMSFMGALVKATMESTFVHSINQYRTISLEKLNTFQRQFMNYQIPSKLIKELRTT